VATPRNAPVKRVAKKAAPKVNTIKAKATPGDPKFDWRSIYGTEVELFKFTSEDGFTVCLPKYEDPGEGEVFGLMLMNKSETDLLIYVMRQHITHNAIDPEGALLVTFQALQKMRAPGVIETLLKDWPEASGKDLGKYSQS
jgi:hypothetical protein